MASLKTPWVTVSMTPTTKFERSGGNFAMDCCHQASGRLRSGPPARRDWAHEHDHDREHHDA